MKTQNCFMCAILKTLIFQLFNNLMVRNVDLMPLLKYLVDKYCTVIVNIINRKLTGCTVASNCVSCIIVSRNGACNCDKTNSN